MSPDGVLEIWTVFDHPRDFPDCFVARLTLVDSNGARVQQLVLRSENLDQLRAALEDQGLVALPRSPEDDAKIIEVWL